MVLICAAFSLRALGRLQEAVQAMKAGIEINRTEVDWQDANTNASKLSEFLLTLGDISKAVDAANYSVDGYCKNGEEVYRMECKQSNLADVLHQSGEYNIAYSNFQEAEVIQKKRLPEYPFLYGLEGYKFCDFLLSDYVQGQVEKVITRAEKGLEISKTNGWLLAIALDKLTLGRAWMKLSSLDKAKAFLEEAVAGLREANRQDYLPRGLLARAEYYRLTQEYTKAHDDLNEVRDIAELGGMKLHLCDYYLEKKELCLAQGLEKEAAENEKKARELIRETGYGRRRGKLGN